MKSTIKSITVAIAKQLGFLTPDKAEEADECVMSECECPTLVLLVNHGFLNRTQAEQVRTARAKDSVLEDLNENVKRVQFALRQHYVR